ncbi:MAG: FliG C-terminal domain-containing protein [Planctomycetota bacterium]
MNRERQTLELLTLLGDDVANAVLEKLQPDRAQTLRSRMSDELLQKSTISRQREVLDEFECFFQFAMKSKLIDDATREKTQAEDAAAAAESVAGEGNTAEGSEPTALTKAQQEEQKQAGDAAGLVQDSAVSGETETPPAGEGEPTAESQSSEDGETKDDAMAAGSSEASGNMSEQSEIDDPLIALQSLSVHQISAALASEQSRTTAILLSNLPAKFTGEILNLLKPDYQKLVMKELTREQHAPPVLIERIARATFARAGQLPTEPPDSRDHADKVAEMLRSVPKAGRRNMLAAIEEQDPDLAKSLLTRIYRFDDIKSLGKTVVQRVLGEVDSTNLTTALCGAADDVKDAIFVNLSKRARQTIEEEMQFMTNVAESRIRQARDSIAEIIARIDMEGEQQS